MVLWVVACAVLAASLIAASRNCSFWDRDGALLAVGPVTVAVMFAVYLGQPEPDRTEGLVLPFLLGIVAGILTYFGVLFCSLYFAHCG
jgi:hypothetical protein